MIKRHLIRFLFMIFTCVNITALHADTISMQWMNEDGTIYDTTTCNAGDDIILPTAPTKRGYTFLGWNSYTPIEYIQSSGTQYIDTGIVRTENSAAQITFSLLSASKPSKTKLILYGTDPDNVTTTRFYVSASSSGNFTLGLGGGFVGAKTLDTNTHTAIIDSKNLRTYFDDVLYTSAGYTNYITPNKPINITIFYNVTDSASARIYSVKLYDNDVLVRDFIPVLDYNNVPCMYDKVSNTFFYNQGTGDFIAGPVIEE